MSRIEQARKIVENHEAGRIDNQWVDVQTANMLCTVYDHLNEKGRAGFENGSLMRVVAIGWRAVGASS